MRNRIMGVIGVLWGGMICVNAFMQGAPGGSDAYQRGSAAGILFGVAMLLAGAYALVKGGPATQPAKRRSKRKPKTFEDDV